MKLTTLLILLLCAAGCSHRPCVDGERTSGYFGSVKTGYDPCPQKCCSPEWHRGCACSARCPCVARHPKQAEP